MSARYGEAARAREEALCCPVEYPTEYLEVIPADVIERDYGCGDPSRYVRPGDTVLDLGSGGGKIGFIAAQIAGREGRIIGVDMTDEMLSLARGAAPIVADRLGYANVEFRRGLIQDLALDLDALEEWIVQEIYRVLRVGGRLAVSDIVCDEEVPSALKDDPDLWSGCVSGAFHELELLEAFEQAGFHGIAIDKWESAPFAVVDGIEFRSVTVTAHKGKEGPCLDGRQAVVYAGPWKRVEDDDGHVLERGARSAVCAKTHRLLTSEPYASQTIGIEPHAPVPEEGRVPFDRARTAPRHPRESKDEAREGVGGGETARATREADGAASDEPVRETQTGPSSCC